MAILNSTLFFKSNRTYGVGSITFDLILDESHALTNDITEYKIEDGSTISDHIQNRNRQGTVTGLITNFSLNEFVIITNKAQNAYIALVDLWKKKELVDIVVVYDVYKNVLINNISINRDASTGESLVANFSFTETKIVQLQQLTIAANVELSDMGSDLNRQSALQLNAGKTTPL